MYAYYVLVLNTLYIHNLLDVSVYRVRSPNVRFESAFDRSLVNLCPQAVIRPPPQPDALYWLLATASAQRARWRERARSRAA